MEAIPKCQVIQATQKKKGQCYTPVGISASNSKTKGKANVKPKALSEFSGNRCNHRRSGIRLTWKKGFVGKVSLYDYRYVSSSQSQPAGSKLGQSCVADRYLSIDRYLLFTSYRLSILLSSNFGYLCSTLMNRLVSDFLFLEPQIHLSWKTPQVLVVGVLHNALVTRVTWKILQRVSSPLFTGTSVLWFE